MAPRLPSQRHPRNAHSVAGPVSFLNPTKAYVEAGAGGSQSDDPPSAKSSDAKPEGGGTTKADDAPGVYHLWRSRDNRKGRHAVIVPPHDATHDDGDTGAVSHPGTSDSARGIMRGLWKMLTRYPVWDVSYDVAVIFTLGSVVWVFNGFFVWLPTQSPWTEFPGEVDYGGGITAFVGATIFEIGSVLLMFEAVNENRTECFGWALEEAIGGGTSPPRRQRRELRPRPEGCSHHHAETRSLIKATDGGGGGAPSRSWAWWPTWEELRTHYLREIGFLACLSQFLGATIFWIAGLTGLPSIYDALSVPVANGIYWLPQVVGGSGFIVSGWLFMLETQPSWYRPAFGTLGWHIGFWNLVGAIGFTLCGALGFASENESAAYASSLTTFIGSWAFLIGSVVQWYESLSKYPINVSRKALERNNPKSSKSESQDML